MVEEGLRRANGRAMLPIIMSDSARKDFFKVGDKELGRMYSAMLTAGAKVPQEVTSQDRLREQGRAIGAAIARHIAYVMDAGSVEVTATYDPCDPHNGDGGTVPTGMCMSFSPVLVNSEKNCTVKIEDLWVEAVFIDRHPELDSNTYLPATAVDKTELSRAMLDSGDDPVELMAKTVAMGIERELYGYAMASKSEKEDETGRQEYLFVFEKQKPQRGELGVLRS